MTKMTVKVMATRMRTMMTMTTKMREMKTTKKRKSWAQLLLLGQK